MSIANAIIHGTVQDVLQAAKANEHLNFIDEYGYTPLIEACIVDDMKKVEAVLKFDPDIHQADLVGNTALHWAVDNNNIKLCRRLLELGANPNAYTIAGMPVLVNPLLRNQADLKDLLVSHGASLTFPKDFINAKLLAHRFELVGYADIVNANNEFVEIGLEGFILEFTLETLRSSIEDYRNNFSARKWQHQFVTLRAIIGALSRASTLTRFQHYNIDHTKHFDRLAPIIETDPLIIPVAQEGHALTLVRAGNLLAMCDRATYEGQDKEEDKVKIYYMNKPWKLTPEYVGELIYVQQTMPVFHKMLPAHLGLQEVARLPLKAQVAGNCSWANIEACVPALFYMICMNDCGKTGVRLQKDKHEAMSLYQDWRLWDQQRALDYFIQNFSKATKQRQASIAELLCSVLFQSCSADRSVDRERIEKIVPLLKTEGLEHISQSYIEAYCNRKKTAAGENFKKMMRMGADVFDFD